MRVALSVFGRAPQPGRAKTRLAGTLGEAGAASLYGAFLTDVLQHAGAAPAATRAFWSSDDAPCTRLEALLGVWPRRVQPTGDLGARMHAALEAGCAAEGAALVLGSDVPSLPPRFIELACAALDRADVVLGPCADGGYYLVAARRVGSAMFEGVRWSTRHARADTERACRAAGLSLAHAPSWYDVDTPRDLQLLSSHLRLRPSAAPASARWLAEHRRTVQKETAPARAPTW